MLHSTQEYDISGIFVAVKTLFMYPVSACAAECSFRSMKRLKTPLQNTMTDDRLSLLAISTARPQGKKLNVESVRNQFAQHKERHLALAPHWHRGIGITATRMSKVQSAYFSVCGILWPSELVKQPFEQQTSPHLPPGRQTGSSWNPEEVQ